MKHATNPLRSLLEETYTCLAKSVCRKRELKMAYPAFKDCLAHAHRGNDVTMSYTDGAHACAQGLTVLHDM